MPVVTQHINAGGDGPAVADVANVVTQPSSSVSFAFTWRKILTCLWMGQFGNVLYQMSKNKGQMSQNGNLL